METILQSSAQPLSIHISNEGPGHDVVCYNNQVLGRLDYFYLAYDCSGLRVKFSCPGCFPTFRRPPTEPSLISNSTYPLRIYAGHDPKIAPWVSLCSRPLTTDLLYVSLRGNEREMRISIPYKVHPDVIETLESFGATLVAYSPTQDSSNADI